MKQSCIRVFRFRHGQTAYTELNPDVPTTKDDLTEEGRQQITQSVTRILSLLSNEHDSLMIFASPRIRTQASAAIAKQLLMKSGFTFWNDQSSLHIAENLRSLDILDHLGRATTKKDPKFRSVNQMLTEELVKITLPTEHKAAPWARGNPLPHIEPFAAVQHRARQQMVLFFEIAHGLKPRDSKNLVIFSFEHLETLDELTERLSEGAVTLKVNNALGAAEPLELCLSTIDTSFTVALPFRPEFSAKKIIFDALENRFQNTLPQS